MIVPFNELSLWLKPLVQTLHLSTYFETKRKTHEQKQIKYNKIALKEKRKRKTKKKERKENERDITITALEET